MPPKNIREVRAQQAANWDDGTGPAPEKSICGWPLSKKNPKRQNDDSARCTKPAGYGTDHVGFGACKYHGGNSKTHSLHGAKLEVAHRMGTYGTPVDVSPKDALLAEVQRTAGHVEWLNEQIQQMEKAHLVGETLKGEQQMSAWIGMYQEERKMLVQVCRVAISMGVAERHVQIAEEQGRIMAMVLMQFMQSSELGLTPEQMLRAKPLAAGLLRSLPSNVSGQGTVVVPARSVEREADKVLNEE